MLIHLLAHKPSSCTHCEQHRLVCVSGEGEGEGGERERRRLAAEREETGQGRGEESEESIPCDDSDETMMTHHLTTMNRHRHRRASVRVRGGECRSDTTLCSSLTSWIQCHGPSHTSLAPAFSFASFIQLVSSRLVFSSFSLRPPPPYPRCLDVERHEFLPSLGSAALTQRQQHDITSSEQHSHMQQMPCRVETGTVLTRAAQEEGKESVYGVCVQTGDDRRISSIEHSTREVCSRLTRTLSERQREREINQVHYRINPLSIVQV